MKHKSRDLRGKERSGSGASVLRSLALVVRGVFSTFMAVVLVVGLLPLPAYAVQGMRASSSIAAGFDELVFQTTPSGAPTIAHPKDSTRYNILYELGAGENAAGNPTSYGEADFAGGGTVTVTGEPAQEAYDFVSWTVAVGGHTIRGVRTFTLTGITADGQLQVTYTTVGSSTGTSRTIPLEDLTFTAVWEPLVYSVVVNGIQHGSGAARYWFADSRDAVVANPADPADNTYTTSSITYTVLDKAATLALPAHPGYRFVGWSGSGLEGTDNRSVAYVYDAPTGMMKVVGTSAGGLDRIKYVSLGALTFTANWEIENYEVTFAANGAPAVSSQTVPYYGKATHPTTMTRLGYNFVGWYTDSACSIGKEFSFDSPITNNTQLFAKWVPNTYTIVYNGNGGSVACAAQTDVAYDDQLDTESTSIPLVATATRPGYIFEGWSKTLENAVAVEQGVAGATVDFGFSSPGNIPYLTENLTWADNGICMLYATWKKASYTLAQGALEDASSPLFTTTPDVDESWAALSAYPSSVTAVPFDTTVYLKATVPVGADVDWTVVYDANGDSVYESNVAVEFDAQRNCHRFTMPAGAVMVNVSGQTGEHSLALVTSRGVSLDAYTDNGSGDYTIPVNLASIAAATRVRVYATLEDGCNLVNELAAQGGGWSVVGISAAVQLGTAAGDVPYLEFTMEDKPVAVSVQVRFLAYNLDIVAAAHQEDPSVWVDGEEADVPAVVSIDANGAITDDTAKATMQVYRYAVSKGQAVVVAAEASDGYEVAGLVAAASPTSAGVAPVNPVYSEGTYQRSTGFLAPAGDVTVTPSMCGEKLTVVFYSGDGSGILSDPRVSENVLQLRYGDVFIPPANTFIAPLGYRDNKQLWEGSYRSVWNTEETGGGEHFYEGLEYPMDSNLVLYPQWVYSGAAVTFNPVSASGVGTGSMDEQVVERNAAATLNLNQLLPPVGHHFAYWSNRSASVYDASVSFVSSDVAEDAHDAATRYFKDGASVSFASDVELFAVWAPDVYTVTFHSNYAPFASGVGEVLPNPVQKFTYGVPAVLLSDSDNNFSLPGFEFVGYNTQSDGQGVDYPVGMLSLSQNLDLFAQWEEELSEHAITLSGTGATNLELKLARISAPVATSAQLAAVKHKTRVYLAGADPLAGYRGDASATPLAWTVQRMSDGRFFNGSAWVAQHSTLDTLDFFEMPDCNVAVSVSAEPFHYTVHYTVGSVQGTSPTGSLPADANITFGSSVVAAGNTGNLQYADYTLLAWSCAGTRVEFGATLSPLMRDSAGNPEPDGTVFLLEGVWEQKVVPVVTHTVSFNSMGGSSVNSQQVNDGACASRPIDPTRTHYAFAGWYSDSELKNVCDFSKPVNSSFTLFAKWNAITYQLTVNANGGSWSGTTPMSGIAGSTVFIANPTRKNYSFAGWTLSGGGSLSGSNYTFGTTNGTLTATWKANTRHMFRMYSPYTSEHFYTATASERDQLVSYGWKFEGIGWNAPVVSNTPVYRLYSLWTGDHHYTTNASERDMLVAAGWRDEGIGWYSADTTSGLPNWQAHPLYRMYAPFLTIGQHHYTVDASEADFLSRNNWQPEGVGWYAMS